MSQDDLEALDPELDDLLAAERRRPAAPPGARASVLSRVHATLSAGALTGGGGGGGADPAGPPPPGPPAAAPPAAGAGAAGGAGAAPGVPIGGALTKALVVGLSAVALGGALIAGVAWGPSPRRPPSTSAPALPPSGAPRALDERSHPPAEAAEPEGERAPAPAASAAAPPPRAPAEGDPTPAGRDADLAAERALLDEAQRAVTAGRTGAAFAALERHAREFPRGRLSEEREALWIQALLGAGRTEEARLRAGRFRRAFPRSMLLPTLEDALGTIP